MSRTLLWPLNLWAHIICASVSNPINMQWQSNLFNLWSTLRDWAANEKSFNPCDVMLTALMYFYFSLSLFSSSPAPPPPPRCLWSLVTRWKGHRSAHPSIHNIEGWVKDFSKLQLPLAPVFPCSGSLKPQNCHIAQKNLTHSEIMSHYVSLVFYLRTQFQRASPSWDQTVWISWKKGQ